MGVLREAKKQFEEEISKKLSQLIDDLKALADEIDDEQLYDEYYDLICSINRATDDLSLNLDSL